MQRQEAPESLSDGEHEEEIIGLPPLKKVMHVQKAKPELQQAMEHFVNFLSACIRADNWDDVEKTMKLLWYCSQKSNSFARLFVQANGTNIVLDLIRHASGDPGKSELLDYSTALLLECVKTHEESSDVVVESEVIRLLLQLLQSEKTGSFAKQHIAQTVHYLAGAKLLYKDVLQGAGTLTVILELLQDSTALCDLQVVQELLWALICLADDDLVYKDLFREAGTLQTLVNLLQVYQAPGVQDKAAITALIIRCLHVLTFGDDISKETLRQLGLVENLVMMLQQLVFGRSPPHGAASGPTSPTADITAAAAATIADCAPEHTAADPADADPTTAADTLKESGSATPKDSGSPTKQDSLEAATVGADTEPQADKSYPQDSEAAAVEEAKQATPDGASMQAPKGLLDKVLLCWAFGACAASKGMEQARVEMIKHSLLLPALPLPSNWGQRALDLVKEVTGTLKSIMCNSPENQEAAVKAGIVPCLVRLLHGYTVEVTWEASEAISYMVAYKDLFIEQGAVERLVFVLRDCAQALSLLASTPRAVTSYTPPRVSEADNPLPMSGDMFASQHKSAGLGLAASTHRPSKLDGRQHTNLVATNSQFSFGDYACFCGYYVPSAAMKALLRLMTMDSGVQHRMIRAGGVAALFGLLRSEVHNPQSRLASSVVSLLNVVMDNNALCRDEVRRVGGIEVLCKALDHAVRSGVSDVYQLKSSLCAVLQKAVEGDDANKGLVRDLGGLHSLVSLMEQAAILHSSGEVDDAEQAAASAVTTVCSVIPGVPTNQAALNNLGAIPIMAQMILKERTPSIVMCSAIQGLGLLAENNPSCQLSIAATGVVPVMMVIAGNNKSHPVAADVCTALCTVMKNNKFVRDTVSANGAVQLLTELLALGADSPTAAAAARALYILCSEDTEMQNKITDGGGLKGALQLLAAGADHVATKYALVLLATVVRHNTFTKNTARALDVVPTLLQLLKASPNPQIATLAAGAVAELCDSNHGNQDAFAAEGGIEVLVALLQKGCGQGLEYASKHKQLIEEAARGLGNIAELHPANKALVREAGGVAALTAFTMLCANDSTMHTTLAAHHMVGTVKEVASAVAKLAQDSTEGQYSFATEMGFIPSLFKLLSVEDPPTAVEVAKALEYVAIRSSAADLDEDPFDFEMDAVKVFIKALQLGGSQAAAVAEAAGVMRAIVAISERKLQPSTSGRRLRTSLSSVRSSRGGIDDDEDSTGAYVRGEALANGSRLQSLSSLQSNPSTSLRPSFTGNVTERASTASNPGTVFDHSSGLAVTPGLHDPYSLHTQTSVRLPGEGAAAFQEAAKLISDGPWRAFKHQVAWMLYLLAMRSTPNRELIKHLERTNVAPLSQQLATAEAFQSTMLLALQNRTPGQLPTSSSAPNPHANIVSNNRLASFLEDNHST